MWWVGGGGVPLCKVIPDMSISHINSAIRYFFFPFFKTTPKIDDLSRVGSFHMKFTK